MKVEVEEIDGLKPTEYCILVRDINILNPSRKDKGDLNDYYDLALCLFKVVCSVPDYENPPPPQL